MVPRLGRNYKDYLNVDLFTAKREFDFREAFSRSIVVKVVHGIPARIASESDLKILDSLSTRAAGEVDVSASGPERFRGSWSASPRSKSTPSASAAGCRDKLFAHHESKNHT